MAILPCDRISKSAARLHTRASYALHSPNQSEARSKEGSDHLDVQSAYRTSAYKPSLLRLRKRLFYRHKTSTFNISPARNRFLSGALRIQLTAPTRSL